MDGSIQRRGHEITWMDTDLEASVTPRLVTAPRIALTLAYVLSCSTVSRAQDRPTLVQSIDIQVPTPPMPVRIAGTRHLAYELHITNFRTSEVELTGVDILDPDRNVSVRSYRDRELAATLSHAGKRDRAADARVVGAGVRAVMFLWLALDDSLPMPARLRHRIELDVMTPSGRERAMVEGAASDVRGDAPVALDPPLRGGPWAAVYDPTMIGGHRTSIYAVDGKARIPGRFAIDWIKLDEDARPARGDATSIANWHGYGADVLAVADGVVSDIRDDMPESPLPSTGPRASIPLEAASGNYITLDLGGGRYAFYEHLARGSVRVRPGDRVTRGQVIGRLGNSGSSSAGPHLHFHVADTNAALGAEGLPWVLRGFEVLGGFDTIASVATGARWKPVPPNVGGRRTMELPAANTVIAFPPAAAGATASPRR